MTKRVRHDYAVHGAGREDGRVIGRCTMRHARQKFLHFLATINRESPSYPDPHLIADNYQIHKRPAVIAGWTITRASKPFIWITGAETIIHKSQRAKGNLPTRAGN